MGVCVFVYIDKRFLVVVKDLMLPTPVLKRPQTREIIDELDVDNLRVEMLSELEIVSVDVGLWETV